ncbi:MAG: type III-B CRISPR-associated protein Cas10/Cmr2, partial [Pseudomonadota bacterium]
MNQKIWKSKLATWLHDPAEKALILLRDKTGHEWGTVATLREQIFGSRDIPSDVAPYLRRADWYASAADRPQFPLEDDGKRYATWSQVDFASKPVLRHPLTGTAYDLGTLKEITVENLKQVSTDHFQGLICEDDTGQVDLKKTCLNYWRFGPNTPADDLYGVWQNLPADTRIPDHSIWSHLDISSAFAGAMAADATQTPALLSVSFGPVQSFIAEARSTSDLWAGSHLMARIAWVGMKVICEELGPDAILFPNLRGVPLMDVWLRDEVGLPDELFHNEEWANKNQRSDANALFAAALPNRFVALVPENRAQALAEKIRERVQGFVLEQGRRALDKILKEIDESLDSDLHCYKQLKEQLQGFPEVYWAAVPWSLAEGDRDANGYVTADDSELRPILGNFFPEDGHIGFLDSEAWKLLSGEIKVDGARFYRPNPGTLYPAIHELLDRVAAAAKSARPFAPLEQVGYRSSLNGEREWLTLDEKQLSAHKPDDTLWTRLSVKKPGWVKLGENLDALNMLKRLWPTLFSDWVGKVLGNKLDRYVVSTHTQALAVSLNRWLTHPGSITPELRAELESDRAQRTALPRCLLDKLYRLEGTSFFEDAKLVCRNLPGLLDSYKEREEEDKANQLEKRIRDEIFDDQKPEAYYGMILFDGDHMGAWLAGNEKKYQQKFGDCWHPAIRASVKDRFKDNPDLESYINEFRSPSPARHRAISEALNNFSLQVARFVVEDCYKGKLIYAGGDDVLAFVCVDDLLPVMTLLRLLYSGKSIPGWLEQKDIESKNGYLRLKNRLILTMGERATASCGAIVAHHQAPLGLVLRELRVAESQAKDAGGRDAFSLKIVKRGGGAIGITDRWLSENAKGAAELLFRLMKLFSRQGISRRAAYNSVTWLNQMEASPNGDMLKANLAHQFKQQGADDDGIILARELVAHVNQHHREESRDFLANFLMVAEFLARES